MSKIAQLREILMTARAGGIILTMPKWIPSTECSPTEQALRKTVVQDAQQGITLAEQVRALGARFHAGKLDNDTVARCLVLHHMALHRAKDNAESAKTEEHTKTEKREDHGKQAARPDLDAMVDAITKSAKAGKPIFTIPRRRPLSEFNVLTTAMTALREALIEHGEIDPITNNFCVKLIHWRRQCQKTKLTKTGKPRSEAQAFLRTKTKLIDMGLVGVSGRWHWIPDFKRKAEASEAAPG